jgi:hypothetical protein
MSWMLNSTRNTSPQALHASRAKEAILASVQRGLLLASASRRLQDPISSRRASAEAQHLLSDAKKLCEETTDLEFDDGRIRVAIDSLTRALEAGDRTQDQ